jgi:RNA polymerase sigma-70 factor (ECF subfamily)
MPTLDPQSLTRHVDRLYRAAWGLCGSREDAEDLVQDTFARVLARPRTLRGDDELAYLMKVLRNTFFTSRRTASRRPRTGTQLEEGIAADERASAQPAHALEVKELYGAIAELSEDFRLALVAVDILGLSYREAADTLGAREATITTRLFRARRQVVQALSGDAAAIGASPDGHPPARATNADTGAAAAAGSAPGASVSRAREDTGVRERLAEQGKL